MTDKGRRKAKNGGTPLDERGARRTTHLIEATYVAYGDVRYALRVYNRMKTRESGFASDRGARRRDCLSSSRGARKDPEMMSCRVARALHFGLDKAQNGTSKSHGNEWYRENNLSTEPTTSTHKESQLVAW